MAIPRRRVWLGFLTLWLVLTLVAGVVRGKALVAPTGPMSGWSDGPIFKPVANFLTVACLPVDVVLRATRISARWPRLGVAVSSAVTGAGLVGGVALVIGLRRRLIVPRDQAVMSPGRRRFLVDGALGLATVPAGIGAAASTLGTPWDLRVRRYSVAIRSLPRGLDGYRVVQVSDTHLGPKIPGAFIEKALRAARDLSPDLFVITGDYIYSRRSWIVPAAEQFRLLTSGPVPVVGVLGNHDWWADGPAMSRALVEAGVRMIDNGRVFVEAGTRRVVEDVPARDAICIAGLGDFSEDVVDVERALGGVPEDMPRLVLEHIPDAAEMTEWSRPGAPRVDLMLCGHTHGGQVRLPFVGTPMVPSRYGSKYAGGLVQGPRFPVIVSRGVGMSIVPVRLGVPPEIVEVTLLRA